MTVRRTLSASVAGLVGLLAAAMLVAAPAQASPTYPPTWVPVQADKTVVAPDGSVHFIASGYVPGSTVIVTVGGPHMNASTRLLVKVGKDGTVRVTLRFTALGKNMVMFAGKGADGSTLKQSKAIRVLGGATDASGVVPASGGVSPGLLAVLVVAVLAGFGLLLVGLRRRPARAKGTHQL